MGVKIPSSETDSQLMIIIDFTQHIQQFMAILRNNNVVVGTSEVRQKIYDEHSLNTWSRAPEAGSQTKGGSYVDNEEDYKGHGVHMLTSNCG